MTPDDEDTVVAALRNYAIRAPQDSGLADEAEREYVSLARDHAALLDWATQARAYIEVVGAYIASENGAAPAVARAEELLAAYAERWDCG